MVEPKTTFDYVGEIWSIADSPSATNENLAGRRPRGFFVSGRRKSFQTPPKRRYLFLLPSPVSAARAFPPAIENSPNLKTSFLALR